MRFLKMGRGSIEGYKAAKSTPIVMNGSGYLNPTNWRAPNILSGPAKPNTLKHMMAPGRISGNITDYTKLRRIATIDSRIKNLF